MQPQSGRQCPKCQGIIPAKAKKCMHCGTTIGITVGQVVGAVAIVLVGFLIVAMLVGSWT